VNFVKGTPRAVTCDGPLGFVALALQAQVREAGLKLNVTVEAA